MRQNSHNKSLINRLSKSFAWRNEPTSTSLVSSPQSSFVPVSAGRGYTASTQRDKLTTPPERVQERMRRQKERKQQHKIAGRGRRCSGEVRQLEKEDENNIWSEKPLIESKEQKTSSEAGSSSSTDNVSNAPRDGTMQANARPLSPTMRNVSTNA